MSSMPWRDISLFVDFPDTWLEVMEPFFDIVEQPAGSILIEEGTAGDEMFILVEGRVRITKSMLLKDLSLPLAVVENPRKVLATLDHSSHPIFGEIALIDSDLRSATVSVLDDSRFLRIDRSRFFSLTERYPEIGLRLLMALALRMAATVRKSNAELVKLSTALALALSRAKGV